MSKPSDTEPSDRKVLFSAIGWIGVIFCFLLVLAVAYLPNRAPSQYEADAEARYEIRNVVRGEQATLVDAYEWVNRDEGVVRIPVERAMRLTVEELRSGEGSRSEPAP
ncbi:MAG TPA: hypothetical protein VJ960_03235 [Oceanipulchritudo sp.]|nr:hypothetical protein [Oceanipulchritudo sp.]